MGNMGWMGMMAQMGGLAGLQQGMQQGMQQGANKGGPAGCNLFIYHVPPTWGDDDIRLCFSPFGSVISATIMKDRATGASKGYGFVSYDNPVSAQTAVQAMNGMQVDGKRLKVELKTAKGQGPY
jgi:CUG-BP- and ETR3-like factor